MARSSASTTRGANPTEPGTSKRSEAGEQGEPRAAASGPAASPAAAETRQLASQAVFDRLMDDILETGCDILTIGQYLQPTPQHLAIDRWVTPEEFAEWKQFGLSIGIGVIESGPLVRSSYHADEQSARYTGAQSLHTAATAS